MKMFPIGTKVYSVFSEDKGIIGTVISYKTEGNDKYHNILWSSGELIPCLIDYLVYGPYTDFLDKIKDRMGIL